MSFGKQLRKLRKEQGHTQEKLAQMVGLAKSTITNYERDKRQPDVFMIKKLAAALNTTGDELLGIIIEPEIKKEPSSRSEAAQELIDMLDKVPDEKLPAFKALLLAAIEATS